MLIRLASPQDTSAIWAIMEPTIRAGETYTLDRDMTRDAALAYWLASDKETFVAEDEDGEVVGTYYIRSNQAGGGAHVCNCGYMTNPQTPFRLQGPDDAKRLAEAVASIKIFLPACTQILGLKRHVDRRLIDADQQYAVEAAIRYGLTRSEVEAAVGAAQARMDNTVRALPTMDKAVANAICKSAVRDKIGKAYLY